MYFATPGSFLGSRVCENVKIPPKAKPEPVCSRIVLVSNDLVLVWVLGVHRSFSGVHCCVAGFPMMRLGCPGSGPPPQVSASRPFVRPHVFWGTCDPPLASGALAQGPQIWTHGRRAVPLKPSGFEGLQPSPGGPGHGPTNTSQCHTPPPTPGCDFSRGGYVSVAQGM